MIQELKRKKFMNDQGNPIKRRNIVNQAKKVEKVWGLAWKVLLITIILAGLVGFVVVPKVFAATGCFPDTNGHWAETFICWLKDNGITGGYPDGTYKPDWGVTRGEMAVFVKKAYDLGQSNDDDTLDSLSCSLNQDAKWNGSAWTCHSDYDTDVLADLSCGTNQIAKWNGSAWACASDVDTSGNSGWIFINSGPQNWIPFYSNDNLIFTYAANTTLVEKQTTGQSYISIAPDLPSVFYGKRLYLNGLRFCYNASTSVYINALYIRRQYEYSQSTTLASDLTNRTDEGCRTYMLSTPFLLGLDDSVNLLLNLQWNTANANLAMGKTTFFLTPSSTNAGVPEGTILEPGGKGGEGTIPD